VLAMISATAAFRMEKREAVEFAVYPAGSQEPELSSPFHPNMPAVS
jgi:hypothetical protein